MTPEQLRDVLDAHAAFVKGLRGGKRADLRHRDLSGIEFPGVNLEHAVLAGVVFRDSVLTGAKFGLADLFGASFEGLNTSERRPSQANLAYSDGMDAPFSASSAPEWSLV